MKFLYFFFILFLVVSQKAFVHQPEDYRLKVADEIEVVILGQPELSKRFIIRPDGKINFPLIGEVEAEGKTIVELTNLLKQKLSFFLPISEISINLVSGKTIRVYIFGEVKNPGEYTFAEGEKVTLLKLLAKAGGPTSSANLKEIKIIKINSQIIKVNMAKNYSKSNIEIEPDSTVVVPKKRIAELSLIQTISWLIWIWLSSYVMIKGL